MGYDAYVRCNCFEHGNIKPFKYLKYVKVYPEGLDLELPANLKSNQELSYKIQDEFYDWIRNACEHDYMEFATKRLCNISGMSWIRSCVNWLNENNEFSTLQNQLPKSNDGFMPIEYNELFIKEFKAFLEKNLVLYRIISDGSACIFYSYGMKENEDSLLCENKDYKLHSCNDSFRIEKNNEIIFESSKFKITRISNKRFIFQDKNQTAESTIFFDLDLFGNGKTHTLSYEKLNFNMKDEFQYLSKTFEDLINASNITKNPICWA